MSCTALQNVEMLGSVTNIGNQAFARCPALKSIDLGDALEFIDGSAFDSCTGLEPEDPDSFFRADIRIEDGAPVVTPIPDLNEGGTRNVRVYRVLGATTLGPGAEWDDVTDLADLAETGYRFFKAAVSLPPQP